MKSQVLATMAIQNHVTHYKQTTIPALRVLHCRDQADKFKPAERPNYARIIDQKLGACHE